MQLGETQQVNTPWMFQLIFSPSALRNAPMFSGMANGFGLLAWPTPSIEGACFMQSRELGPSIPLIEQQGVQICFPWLIPSGCIWREVSTCRQRSHPNQRTTDSNHCGWSQKILINQICPMEWTPKNKAGGGKAFTTEQSSLLFPSRAAVRRECVPFPASLHLRHSVCQGFWSVCVQISKHGHFWGMGWYCRSAQCCLPLLLELIRIFHLNFFSFKCYKATLAACFLLPFHSFFFPSCSPAPPPSPLLSSLSHACDVPRTVLLIHRK